MKTTELSFPAFKKLCGKLGLLNTFSSYAGYDNKTPINSWYDRDLQKKREKDLNGKGWYGYVQCHHGTEGGNCWGGEANESFSYPSKEDDAFLELLLEELAPNITLLQFKKLARDLKKHDFEVGERCYYGNSSQYSGHYYILQEVFLALIEHGVIIKAKKEAVLIGGLPCAGKTTLAKEEYGDYFLIDDPATWADVKKHLKKKRIVIADPYLSFKEKREDATKKLTEAGFDVSVVTLKVNKHTLKKRAREMGREDKIPFIRDFNLQ